jgi:hypothetical protein
MRFRTEKRLTLFETRNNLGTICKTDFKSLREILRKLLSKIFCYFIMVSIYKLYITYILFNGIVKQTIGYIILLLITNYNLQICICKSVAYFITTYKLIYSLAANRFILPFDLFVNIIIRQSQWQYAVSALLYLSFYCHSFSRPHR